MVCWSGEKLQLTVQVLWWLYEVMVQDPQLCELQSSEQVSNQDLSVSQSAEVGLAEPTLDF